MALASIPASPATDGSTSPMDAYLLEVYRQAAETTRPGHSRFFSLGAFLTIVSLLTAALAVLFSVLDGSSGPLRPAVCMALGVIGLVVSALFYGLEVRRHQALVREMRFDGPAYATSSIYQASIGFFGFAVVIGTALLLIR
jgi:heme/copper-type cytochrome/quinol oxidase subunit 3